MGGYSKFLGGGGELILVNLAFMGELDNPLETMSNFPCIRKFICFCSVVNDDEPHRHSVISLVDIAGLFSLLVEQPVCQVLNTTRHHEVKELATRFF